MLYKNEREIKLIEEEYSRIQSEMPGKYLSETTDKYELTERLLEKYREIRFQVENSCGTMLQHEKKIMDEIGEWDKKQCNINEYCKEHIEDAVRKVKAYPKYGLLYYRILQYRFMMKDCYTYEMIAKMNKTSKQNILQKKKEAIRIVSSLLWDTAPSEIALEFATQRAKLETDRTGNITFD